MKSIKFHKSECGVDIFLNVLYGELTKQQYINSEPYTADYFEILIFKKISGTALLNQVVVPLIDSSVVFISPNQKRNWDFQDGDLDFTVLLFHESFLNDFFSDKLFPYKLLYFYQSNYNTQLALPQEQIAKLCSIMLEIKHELVYPRADSSHLIRSLLYYVLQKFNRFFADAYNLPIVKNDNNYAYEFKRLLEKFIKTEQRLEFYANAIGISRITLNKVVQKQFATSSSALLKDRLIYEIKDLLINSRMTTSEVAYALNFSEPNHMGRFFKSHTGMTIGNFVTDYQNGIHS